ncbi:MAG: UDP-N-acetylmuramate dehydrogenase [Bacilli bacterium]|nr:UDP-N-acetylmuramate dehydrogenase [Bacilli bacterium]
MKKHTSFKIGGNADIFIKAKNVEEIKFILEISKEHDIPLTIIGNGSNVLVKDNGIQGIVLKIDIDEIEISNLEDEKKYCEDMVLDENEKYAIVTVGAGTPLGKLAQVLLKNSISGFEFASGIPGTIGGAIRMNAGAYGTEFKDIVLETTCLDLDKNIIKLNNKQQKFEYRESIFKYKSLIILESKLLLKYECNSINIKEKMDEYKTNRLEKQPIDFPSAGSTFKRGRDFITAKLIDECGLKGYSIGGAQVSTKHAGFIVNKGSATAEDVLNLVDFIKKSVFEKFGKNIELEIEVLGK